MESKIIELFSNKSIEFVNKNEIIEILNKINYFYKFNKIDYKVRNCYNRDDCINKYINNIEDFTDDQKNYLKDICNFIDNIFNDYTKFNNITWRFTKFNKNIESGYPHTHMDVIFLSDNFFENKNKTENITTLLHEKIHIYQRLYEKNSRDFYNSLGFNKSKCICGYNMFHRTNPDDNGDHYIYNGYLVRSQYISNANNLAQINIIFNRVRDFDKEGMDINGDKILKKLRSNYGIQIESENELFACLISLYFIEKINFNNYFPNFEKELKKYLT
jgi:hypothetical protein